MADTNTPAVTSASGGTDPGMLSDWYSSYIKSNPAPATATATNWNVGTDQTVAGNLAATLDAGGPLMDRATTKAAQASNSRGLLNSTIGIQAGQAALYDAALPIAQQDASTKANAAQVNAQTANTTSQFNANATNQATLNRDAAGVQGYLSDKQITANKDLQTGQQTFTAGQNTLDRAQQTALQANQQQFTAGQSALDRAQQTELQASQQAFQTQLQTIQNDQQTRIQQLQEQGMDSRQAAQLAQQEALAKLQEQGVTNRFDAAQALQDKQFNAQLAESQRQQAQANANTLEQMGYQNKLATAQVPSNFAASVSATTLSQVNTIMGDPNLDADAKKNAVANVVAYANSTLGWAEKFYGSTSLGTITSPATSMPASNSGAFNAEGYLRLNPDVAAAVARGETTAEEHWQKYGQAENRKFS